MGYLIMDIICNDVYPRTRLNPLKCNDTAPASESSIQRSYIQNTTQQKSVGVKVPRVSIALRWISESTDNGAQLVCSSMQISLCGDARSFILA